MSLITVKKIDINIASHWKLNVVNWAIAVCHVGSIKRLWISSSNRQDHLKTIISLWIVFGMEFVGKPASRFNEVADTRWTENANGAYVLRGTRPTPLFVTNCFMQSRVVDISITMFKDRLTGSWSSELRIEGQSGKKHLVWTFSVAFVFQQVLNCNRLLIC